MGEIKIEVVGSFQVRHNVTFSAKERGHAEACARAIEFLARDVLPKAIKLDHELHEGGPPPWGFGR